MGAPRIVLASASPRRRELLAASGLEFEVRPSAVDEDLGAFDDPVDAALRLASAKASAGAREWASASERRWVIGADTVVAVLLDEGWRLLGKAADEPDAARMLALLSGSRHLVVTGVAVVRSDDGAQWSDVERTWVTMRRIEPAELSAYVESGEWRDKAGAYAIQESADRFVTRLEEGGFDNVVGLPVRRTLALLRAAGAPNL